MPNKIVVRCFQNEDFEFFLGAKLVVGVEAVDIHGVLVSDTVSLDNMVALYRKIACGLGIPVEVDKEVDDLREEWEEEENG